MKLSLFDLEIDNKIENILFKKFKELFSRKDFVLGNEVEKFESNFSNYLGNKFSVGVNSGTDALEIALKSLGVNKNSKVVVPGFSFFATSEVVYKLGAKPIFCDINLKDLTMDCNHLEKLLKSYKNIDVVIPVHIFGNSCNMKEIKNLSNKYNFFIVEDVAQASGSNYKNKKLGTIGDIGCFSFYPTKNLGAFGDAGLISTNSKKLYLKFKSLRNHGISSSPYIHYDIGYNSRLDTIQAIVLNEKLKTTKINESIRILNNNLFVEKLKDVNFINLHSQLNQPLNLFPISFSDEEKKIDIVKKLNNENIPFGKYYPLGLHKQPFITKPKTLKNVDWACKNVITLPCHPKITQKEINYICSVILN